MRQTCPHCKSSVEIGDSPPSVSSCPQCGKDFDIVSLDETIDLPGGSPAVDPYATIAPGSSGASTDPASDVVSVETIHLERALVRFEEAWKAGKRPKIGDYLGQEDERQTDLLVELIHVDLAYRLKTGLDACVEAYLEDFPRLIKDRRTVVELAVAEFHLRAKNGSPTPLEEFLSRLPDYRDDLQVLLKGPARTRRRRFPIRLNCPHCRNPIALVDTDQDQEIACPSCGESFSLDADRTQSWSPSKLPRIGKFQLLNAVGHGTFGTVYRARDVELDRIVAIKVPRSGTFATKEDEDGFIREARTAAQLDHPGIVRVIDAGRAEEYPYIVTEFVRGVPLSDVLNTRHFDLWEAVELLATIADSLEHAHRNGVIHRDLKPGNVMIDIDGRPRVMDFGLAKRDVTEITMSLDGHVLGTPAYMPPEQARGDAHLADQRSDVYALGVMLFELLTGERPFHGNSVAVLQQVILNDPPAIRTLNSKLPVDLETVVAKCLEKPPDRRYPSARELAEDLRRFLRHEPIHARSIGVSERAWRWCKRNPVQVKSAAVIFGTLLIGLFVVSLFWRSESKVRAEKARLATKNDELYQAEKKAKDKALRYFARTRDFSETWLAGPGQELVHFPGSRLYQLRILEQEAEHLESLVREKFDDPAFERERSRTYLQLGDVRRELGDTAAAERAYDEGATLLEKRLASDGTDWESRLTLGTALSKRGVLQHELGQTDRAESDYQAAVELLSAVRTEKPQDPRVHHALGEAMMYRAVLLRGTDAAAAETTAKDALDQLDAALKMSAGNPKHVEFASKSRDFLSTLLTERGATSEALSVVLKGLEVLDEIQVVPDLENTNFIMARAQSRIFLASLLRVSGQVEQELKVYERAIKEYQSLESIIPDSPTLRENIALTRTDLGQLLNQLGRTREAEAELNFSIEIFAELAQSTRRQPSHIEGYAASIGSLANVLMDLGRDDEAKQWLERADQILSSLEREFPQVLAYTYRGAICQSQLGQVYHRAGNEEQSEQCFAQAAETLDWLMEQSPNQPGYKSSAAFIQCYWANMLQDAGQNARAKESFIAARDLWGTVVTDFPAAEYSQNLAQFLTECADPDLRDGRRAMLLAENASRESPRNAGYLTTLGAAQHRVGDWKSAQQTLQSAIDLRGEGTSRDWFFVAMTQWQLGEEEQARASFERGLNSMLAHRPGNRDLARLRDETAKILEQVGGEPSPLLKSTSGQNPIP